MNENEAFEAITSDDTFPKLAGALIARWKKPKTKEVWEQRKTDTSSVETGLRKLLSSGLITAIQLAGAKPTGKIAMAMEAITIFQKLTDLTADGILGRTTLKKMANYRSCNERPERGSELSEDSLARRVNETFGSTDRLAVMVCNISRQVESHFDNMFRGTGMSARDCIVDAWDLWDLPHKIGVARKITPTDDPDNANVLITLAPIDGRDGGTLADAHIGGPNVKQQLTLRIDEEEQFDEPSEFIAVVGHEIGHILGLRHNPSKGHLMSAFYNPSIDAPPQPSICGSWSGTGPSRQ